MCYICQPNIRAISFDRERQAAVYKDMGNQRRGKAVSRHSDVAEPRPARLEPCHHVMGRPAVIATQVVVASDKTEGDSRTDMGENGKTDQERFREGSLVDLASEEEIRFGAGNGAGDEGNDRGCGEVEGRKKRERVTRVSLDASHCGELVSLPLSWRSLNG